MHKGNIKNNQALHLMAHHDVPHEKEQAFLANLKALIAGGANLDGLNNDGETPLQCALLYGSVNTFALFMAQKPNLDFRAK